MRLLIDTHVLLWWLDDPLRISEVARDRISDPENEVFVSAVSCWEIAMKRALENSRRQTTSTMSSHSVDSLNWQSRFRIP
jgi:PIN domain nuclease of toxin-antitoxin system